MGHRPIHDAEGNPLDARFGVEATEAGLSVVLESRGGSRSKPDARNTDYGKGFEILLQRLQARGATIVDAVVDSKMTQHLTLAERRLDVDGSSYPITIGNAEDLQRRIGAAQARVGRKPHARGSGNRTKRVRLILDFPGKSPSASALEDDLAGQLKRQP